MGRGRPARLAIVIALSPGLKQNPPPYRFRPGRSAHQAEAQAQSYVAAGHEWVADIVLEKSFDRVNHGQSLPDDPASAQGQRLEERGGSKWGAKFLGFTISNDPEETRQITAKALEKFKGRVREPTCRTLGVSVPLLIAPLARHLIGWRDYFGFCQTPLVLHNLDAWIRRRFTHVYLATVEERADPVRATAPSGCVPFPRGHRCGDGVWALAHGPPCDGAAGPNQRLLRLARPSLTKKLSENSCNVHVVL